MNNLVVENHVDGHDKSVQTQDLGENENEDHADVESWLLCCSTYTRVADNSNRITCSKTGQTDRQTGAKVNEATEK